MILKYLKPKLFTLVPDLKLKIRTYEQFFKATWSTLIISLHLSQTINMVEMHS